MIKTILTSGNGAKIDFLIFDNIDQLENSFPTYEYIDDNGFCWNIEIVE